MVRKYAFFAARVTSEKILFHASSMGGHPKKIFFYFWRLERVLSSFLVHLLTKELSKVMFAVIKWIIYLLDINHSVVAGIYGGAFRLEQWF